MKFNKIKLIAALCLALGASALGQNNVGTLVTDPIRPFSVNSTNPSAIANEIKGGPFSSSNLVGLSNIPAPRLELGALGYAADTGLYYRLTATNPATWSSINGANITNIPLSGVVGALGHDTNGNVIYNNTNPLSFSNVNIKLEKGGGTSELALQFFTNLTGFYVSQSPSQADPWVFVHNGIVSSVVLTNANQFWRPLSFNNTTNAEISRTNLGLGWSALTNTTASGFGAALYGSNTNPVLVNTNGEVVSPTNFWQAAPIATTLQESTPVINATNAATNARLLFLFSIAPSTVGITNTITLPTNGSTFNGDVATITHTGPTSSVTAIRQLGASTNIITLNQVDESVRFLYRNNQWALMDNISYIEPIYFSGTNAAGNAAASRTNLGLGSTNLVNFAYVEAPYFFVGDGANGIVFETPDVAAITRTNLGIGAGATNTVSFGKIIVPANELTIEDPANEASIITFPNDTDPVALGADYWDHASVRTSLGLGATNNVAFADIEITKAGTNSVYAKNEAGSFQVQIGTNAATFAVSTSSVDIVPPLIAYSNVTVDGNVDVLGALSATSTVTAKTNLVVEGFVDFSTNHTNVAPVTNNQIQKFLQIRIGTNAFFLPLYQ